MKNLKKFGILASCTLLTMAMLTACGGDDTEVAPDVAQPDSAVQTPSEPAGEAGDTDADVATGDEEVMGDMDLATGEEEAPVEGEVDINAPAVPNPADAAKLSTTDFTLKTSGATQKITVQLGTDVKDITYSSSDESIATVSKDGTVTAVANGTATITVKFSSESKDQSLTATVRCDLPSTTDEVAEPETKPSPEPEATPEPEAPQATSVDLSSFYGSISGQFAGMEAVTGAFLENFYPGLSGISLNQQQIYMPMMTASSLEIAIVEVANSGDVDKVKAIFNSRIQTQIDGGAYYPETIEGWKNNATVTSNGNYVMMVVHDNGKSIVSSFNGLF